jgi:parvulin-like peptidyl-prolyl isomerase
MSARLGLEHQFKMVWCGALALAAALVAVPASTCAQQDLVIARIGGQAVTGTDFAPYLRAYLRSKLYHAGAPERIRALADEAIEAFLIDRVLAEQATARKLKIDEAEVEKRLASIKMRFGDRPDWPEIRARLPKLREEIESDSRIEALKRDITRGEPPAEAEIRAFYESRPELFTVPAGYRLKMLLLAVDPGASGDVWRAAEEQAREYERKIASGEDFAALARANSKHSSAEQGGALGLVHEGQLGEAAEAALRTAKPGEVAGPVRLLEGVALFEVEEKRRPVTTPFPEVRERALSLLERDRAKRQWNSHIETIKGRFSIDQSAFATFLASALK